MSVSEMVEAAHQQAVKSGFWDDWREATAIRVNISLTTKVAIHNAFVAQKLVLIGTELEEFDEEVDGDPRDALEELADVVIRTFDLVGLLEIKLDENVLDPHETHLGPDMYSVFEDGAKRIFIAVQNHRKYGDAEITDPLEMMLANIAAASRARYGPDALRRSIERKMEKNRSRPHKHNADY